MNTNQLIPVTWFRPQTYTRALKRVLPADSLFGELDRLFDGLLGQDEARGLDPAPSVRPSLDISGDGKQYTITVEVPGVKAEDLRVDLERNVLTIQGEKKSTHEEKNDGENGSYSFYRVERSYGSFKRVLTLPEDVDVEGIQADQKDGVLTITLPRKAEQQQEQRSIAISAS